MKWLPKILTVVLCGSLAVEPALAQAIPADRVPTATFSRPENRLGQEALMISGIARFIGRPQFNIHAPLAAVALLTGLHHVLLNAASSGDTLHATGLGLLTWYFLSKVASQQDSGDISDYMIPLALQRIHIGKDNYTYLNETAIKSPSSFRRISEGLILSLKHPRSVPVREQALYALLALMENPDIAKMSVKLPAETNSITVAQWLFFEILTILVLPVPKTSNEQLRMAFWKLWKQEPDRRDQTKTADRLLKRMTSNAVRDRYGPALADWLAELYDELKIQDPVYATETVKEYFRSLQTALRQNPKEQVDEVVERPSDYADRLEEAGAEIKRYAEELYFSADKLGRVLDRTSFLLDDPGAELNSLVNTETLTWGDLSQAATQALIIKLDHIRNRLSKGVKPIEKGSIFPGGIGIEWSVVSVRPNKASQKREVDFVLQSPTRISRTVTVDFKYLVGPYFGWDRELARATIEAAYALKEPARPTARASRPQPDAAPWQTWFAPLRVGQTFSYRQPLGAEGRFEKREGRIEKLSLDRNEVSKDALLKIQIAAGDKSSRGGRVTIIIRPSTKDLVANSELTDTEVRLSFAAVHNRPTAYMEEYLKLLAESPVAAQVVSSDEGDRYEVASGLAVRARTIGDRLVVEIPIWPERMEEGAPAWTEIPEDIVLPYADKLLRHLFGRVAPKVEVMADEPVAAPIPEFEPSPVPELETAPGVPEPPPPAREKKAKRQKRVAAIPSRFMELFGMPEKEFSEALSDPKIMWYLSPANNGKDFVVVAQKFGKIGKNFATPAGYLLIIPDQKGHYRVVESLVNPTKDPKWPDPLADAARERLGESPIPEAPPFDETEFFEAPAWAAAYAFVERGGLKQSPTEQLQWLDWLASEFFLAAESKIAIVDRMVKLRLMTAEQAKPLRKALTAHAGAWSLNPRYLFRWAHRIETRTLIPLVAILGIWVPIFFHAAPVFSTAPLAALTAAIYLAPHGKRMRNVNIILLALGTFLASAAFISGLHGFVLGGTLTAVLWGKLIVGAASVELLAQIHRYDNQREPLTQVLRRFAQAA